MPLQELDRLIRDLLAQANQMLAREALNTSEAFPLIDQLMLCAKRADSVKYAYSARLLREAAKALGRKVVMIEPAKDHPSHSSAAS